METRPPLVARLPGPDFDWSQWYEFDEFVHESTDHGEIVRVMLSSLRNLVAHRGWATVYTGAHTYFSWDRSRPFLRTAPDAYLVDHPGPVHVTSWRTWLPGHPPPRWALEVVSQDWRKDYVEGPQKHAVLGTRELVVFDPAAVLDSTLGEPRVPLLVWKRADDGSFVRAHAGPGPVYSSELEAWLVPVGEGYTAFLRLADDAKGEQLILTDAERFAEERRRRLLLERALEEEATARREAAGARDAEAEARQAEAEARQAEARARLEAEREVERLRRLLREREQAARADDSASSRGGADGSSTEEP